MAAAIRVEYGVAGVPGANSSENAPLQRSAGAVKPNGNRNMYSVRRGGAEKHHARKAGSASARSLRTGG